MADDENPEVPPSMAFLVGLNREAVEEHRKMHERQDMARDDFTLRLSRLIDDLPVDHLVTMRQLLNTDSKKYLQFVDGQIYSVLRRVHEVDPTTGEKAGLDALFAASEPGSEGEAASAEGQE